MKRFKLVEYKLFDKVRVYTVLFDDKKQNETDDFISRFSENPNFSEHFQTIIYFIKAIGDNGALERYFRNEGKAKALPVKSSKLRLYCIRISDNILILGNGDIKTAKKIKDCANCFPHFKNMNAIKRVIDNEIQQKSISIQGNKIIGGLNFFI